MRQKQPITKTRIIRKIVACYNRPLYTQIHRKTKLLSVQTFEFLIANTSVQVRLSSVRIMRSVCALSEKMGIKSPRLLSLSNQCAIQVMNFASLRALIDRYSGAKADDWREQIDELIQFIWRNSTQVVQLSREKRKTSLILFFVFLDTSDRIRSGPWETIARV